MNMESFFNTFSARLYLKMSIKSLKISKTPNFAAASPGSYMSQRTWNTINIFIMPKPTGNALILIHFQFRLITRSWHWKLFTIEKHYKQNIISAIQILDKPVFQINVRKLKKNKSPSMKWFFPFLSVGSSHNFPVHFFMSIDPECKIYVSVPRDNNLTDVRQLGGRPLHVVRISGRIVRSREQYNRDVDVFEIVDGWSQWAVH